MLKILLISPPIFDFYYTPARKEPLGLLYIKMALEKIKNVYVDIYDATASGKTKKVNFPSIFSPLKEFYQEDTSPFSLFSGFYRFGDSFNKIIEEIIKGEYKIVGISALFSGYYPDVESLICTIKEKTTCTIVVGGWAVNAEGEKLFTGSKADFFLLGNGEDAFPEFVNAYLNKMPFERVHGIIFRKDGALYSTRPKQTEIPEEFPQRKDKYFFNKNRIAKVVLSRGCFYKCDFCPIHVIQKFSLRSPDSIEKELKYLCESGVKTVDFEDDNLFCTKEFSEQLLPILEKYHQNGLNYVAMNGITAKNILPLVDRIIQAGFIELNLSLVTSDTTISSSIHRPFSLDVIKEIVNKVNGRIKTIVFLILGLFGDKPENILSDILELARLPVIIGVSPLYFIPGVSLFETIGIPEDRRLLRGSALYKFGSSFLRKDVASLWKFVRMINRLKTTHEPFSNQEMEYLDYFHKSLQEKQWYRKTKQGDWEKGFSFSLSLPAEFLLCKLNGRFNIYNQQHLQAIDS